MITKAEPLLSIEETLMLAQVPEAEYLTWEDIQREAAERNARAAAELEADCKSELNLAGAVEVAKTNLQPLLRIAALIDRQAWPLTDLEAEIRAYIKLITGS